MLGWSLALAAGSRCLCRAREVTMAVPEFAPRWEICTEPSAPGIRLAELWLLQVCREQTWGAKFSLYLCLLKKFTLVPNFLKCIVFSPIMYIFHDLFEDPSYEWISKCLVAGKTYSQFHVLQTFWIPNYPQNTQWNVGNVSHMFPLSPSTKSSWQVAKVNF